MNNKMENRAKWRKRLHEIIFGYETFGGKLFDVVLLVAILTSVITVSLESVKSIDNEYHSEIDWLEWMFTGLFTLEYIARIIAVENPRKYIFSAYGIIDLVSLIPSYLGFFGFDSKSLSVIRSIRLIRVFRILKLTRYLKGANHLASSIWNTRHTIIVFLGVVMCIVIIMGTLMYMIEGGQNGFSSIPKSIYWAIVTLTTVGYGDISPATTLGQSAASLLMVLGYSIITVPTGIVTSELLKGNRGKNKKCSNCQSADIQEDSVYCRHCGTKILS